MARALALGVKKLREFMCSRRVAAELTFGGRKTIHNKVKQIHVNVNLQLFLLRRLIWRKKSADPAKDSATGTSEFQSH